MDPNDILIAMKHIFYHLTAVMVVVVWGMTFISTKVLIVHGLSPQEIFLFRFLLAYVAVCPISSHSFLPVIWKMSYAWRVAEYWVVPCSSFYRTWHWGWHRRQMFLSSYVRPRYWQLFWPYCPFGRKRSQEVSYTDLLSLCWVWACWYSTEVSFSGYHLWVIYWLFWLPCHGRFTALSFGVSPGNILRLSSPENIFYGIITILPTFLFLPSLTKPAVLLDSEVWSNLLFLGVIASSACYLLWNIVVKQLGTIQASNYLYLNPLATTVGATIFLHEEVTPVAIGGIVLVLSGVYLATRNSRPQNSTAIKKQADWVLFILLLL